MVLLLSINLFAICDIILSYAFDGEGISDIVEQSIILYGS